MKLIHGDCLEEMKAIPDSSIDMTLSDPPYGMGFVSNHRKEKYGAIINDKELSWLPLVIEELFRVSSETSAHYMFCSFHNIDLFKQAIESKFKVKNLLIWEKNNTSMGDLQGDFAPKVEFIFLFTKGRPLIQGKRDPNIFKFARTGNKLHPTEKPVDLLTYLVTKFSKEGDTILDPFMGSGTTGIACLNLNRNFIGIEKDLSYFNIAKNRIENHN